MGMNKAWLKGMELSNYKSIPSGVIKTSDISVLIGENNSGKSNVVDAFSSFYLLHNLGVRDALPRGWFQRKMAGKQISGTIELSVIYDFPNDLREELRDELSTRQRNHRQLRNKLDDEDFLTEIKIMRALNGEDYSERNTAWYIKDGESWSKIDNFSNLNRHEGIGELKKEIQESINTWRFVDPFRVPQNIGTAGYTTDLEPDGSNLIEVLGSLQMNHSRIFEQISTAYIDIMDGVSDLSIEYEQEEDPQDMTIMVAEENYPIKFKSEEISSGSKEILTLLTQIHLAADESDVLFLEEPELHLYPGAERRVFNIIQDISEQNKLQVVISTHSDVFVNQSEASSITRVERNGSTKLRSIESEEIDTELQDLGYDKSGLLQSEAVVFVEGLSDKRIIWQFAKTAGIDLGESGIELVELEGIENMKRDAKSLIKLLYSFNIPYLFVRDRHGKTVESARGELYESMKREDGQGWWKTSPQNIFVWNAYGIEKYLLSARAIASVFEMSKEDVQKIINESKDIEDKKLVLQKIYSEEYNELPETEAYSKSRDGLYIAKRMNPEELPRETLRLLDEVTALVNTLNDDDLRVDLEAGQ